LNWTVDQWSCLAEALAFPSFVGWYIWKLQAQAPWTAWVMVVWLLASYLARRDTPKTIGWRVDNLVPATKLAIRFFALSFVVTFAVGVTLGMLHRAPSHVLEPRRFGSYLGFCVLQQVGLNSLLTNRLLRAFGGKPVPAALLAGLLFGALHWPNPVLVPITFVGGVAMAWMFAKERNILVLALGQAVLGSAVWWAFPMAWHHSMRVGPGYWTYRAR
jgi:membrane protease YdiL (CAAX protease family)